MSDNVTAIKGLRRFVFSGQRRFHPYGSCSAGNLFPLRLYRTAHSYPRADGTVLPGHRDGNRRGPEGNVYLPRPQGPFPDLAPRSDRRGHARVYRKRSERRRRDPKLFTIGPMFRYERPQKGRMRQFHQINCECLGPSEPYADAELVTMAMRFLEALGLKDLSLQLNSLGCPTCRPAYRETLRKWLSELDESALCEDCRRRMVTNPLRVLDCKVPSCREHTAEAPQDFGSQLPRLRRAFRDGAPSAGRRKGALRDQPPAGARAGLLYPHHL